MRELAKSAGYDTKDITIASIQRASGNPEHLQDSSGEHIRACFKLLPWHKMDEEGAESAIYSAAENTLWIEPFWRNLSENEAILVALSHLFPHNELILPAHMNKPSSNEKDSPKKWIKKSLFTDQKENHQNPLYMYQQNCTPRKIRDQDVHATPSIWMVGDTAVALSVKEFNSHPAGVQQRFTPHIVT